ncbi:MAG: hypothetical protein ABSA77_12895 [Thermoguttaceae bacterium]|jgi:hypothetical protein
MVDLLQYSPSQAVDHFTVLFLQFIVLFLQANELAVLFGEFAAANGRLGWNGYVFV